MEPKTIKMLVDLVSDIDDRDAKITVLDRIIGTAHEWDYEAAQDVIKRNNASAQNLANEMMEDAVLALRADELLNGPLYEIPPRTSLDGLVDDISHHSSQVRACALALKLVLKGEVQ